MCLKHLFWVRCSQKQIDEELDAETPNAGTYRFEKMISGLYMGEIARRIILQLAVSSPLSAATFLSGASHAHRVVPGRAARA